MKLTLRQAAKHAGKAPGTLSKALANGQIFASKDDKERWQIDPSEIQSWIEANRLQIVAPASYPELLTEDYLKGATAPDVERCIAAGADMSARNGNDKTALHMAAGFGNAAAVTALLAAGADVNARTTRATKRARTPCTGRWSLAMRRP